MRALRKFIGLEGFSWFWEIRLFLFRIAGFSFYLFFEIDSVRAGNLLQQLAVVRAAEPEETSSLIIENSDELAKLMLTEDEIHYSWGYIIRLFLLLVLLDGLAY